VNPLWHYVVAGHTEGRDPHPRFDTKFYVQEHPECRNGWPNPLVHYLRVGKQAGFRTNPVFDARLDERRVEAMKVALNPRLPTLMMVAHYLGGGTERHILDLAEVVAGRCNILLFYPIRGGTAKLTVLTRGASSVEQSKEGTLLFRPEEQLAEMAKVISSLGVSRIHVHHTMGNERYLRQLLETLKLPYDFTLHDYYTVSPSPHLCDREGRFIGDPGAATEPRLLAAADVAVASLRDWQDAHRPLVEKAERVIAPSIDLARRIGNVFGKSAIVVVPHPERSGTREVAVRPRRLAGGEPLRVAILGWLLPHKGHAIVQACADVALKRDLPLEFHVVGEIQPQLPTYPKAKLWCTGEYHNGDLPRLLERVAPHLAWFPTQCPESYCYTLSEAMSEGLPVLAGNLGALPERLSGREWSWIVPWNLGAASWLELLLKIRSENFRAQRAPPRPEVDQDGRSVFQVATKFYPEEYLRWVP
jgi:glycosyltransferase involved in cell wall biosynthesis